LKNESCDDLFNLVIFWLHILFVYILMIWLLKWCNCLSCVHDFPIIYIYVHVLTKNKKGFPLFVKRFFVGISLKNPHVTSFVHLVNRGPNRLVAYAKCNINSYKSQL